MPTSTRKLYIGLMSGTSLDSIDCALVSIKQDKIELIDAIQGVMPSGVRTEIKKLNTQSENELHRCLTLSRQLGYIFADCVNALLKKTGVSKNQITAIGCHGQTIRHQPDGQYGFSLQIGDANTIAEETGICVVGDFRSRDIAAGGQGAPLVPLFHHTLFYHPDIDRAVINIGGMANITHVGKDKSLPGFDSGPGNILLDCWCQKHINRHFDDKGQWASQGKINDGLLKQMLAEPYFHRQPPKSTGRELFDQHWLDPFNLEEIKPADVMATLTELTAMSISNAIDSQCQEVYICGGGVHNQYLLRRIQAHCDQPVASTQALGVDPDYVEAKAFAWLADRRLQDLSGNAPETTGAKGSRILGAVYSA